MMLIVFQCLSMKVLEVLDITDNTIHDKGAEVLVGGIIEKVRNANTSVSS